MAVTDTPAPATKKERWTFQWKELYDEVITSGLCTGCAGCVISCPHDVIGYKHEPGQYKPFHLEEELGLSNCTHGEKGCTSCTRACPRFRAWEPEADEHLFGRVREEDEMSGIFKDILLTRASDDFVYDVGQDGGLVSAILIWCLENDIIDGALVSGLESTTEPDAEPAAGAESGDQTTAAPGQGPRPAEEHGAAGPESADQTTAAPGQGPRPAEEHGAAGPHAGKEQGWKAKPMVATNREEVLRGAGSRYTYSANTMAFPEAKERGLDRLALVGMSCQTSIAPVMWHRKVGKVGKPFKLNIGLLCSKSFDDAMFDELFWVKYGLHKDDIVKMNIKGVFQVWMRNGDYHEINLKECHAWTREGCIHCPDFAAEHADISTGGIGDATDWTLTIVRTELGRAVIDAMVKDGVIETRPGDDDPGAIALMHKLAAKSRARWPEWAPVDARVGLPS